MVKDSWDLSNIDDYSGYSVYAIAKFDVLEEEDIVYFLDKK